VSITFGLTPAKEVLFYFIPRKVTHRRGGTNIIKRCAALNDIEFLGHRRSFAPGRKKANREPRTPGRVALHCGIGYIAGDI
jgi:hypothetical protein